MSTDLNIANGIREFARATPRATAVIDGARSLSFAELDDRASRLATAMLAAGLKPGDRVGLLSWNRLEFIEIGAAFGKTGLIVVPLNPRGIAKEHAFILEHSQARGLIVDEALTDAVIGIWEHLDFVVTLGTDGPGEPHERLLARSSARDPRITVAETDEFCIQYTSGTTGAPKGVLLSHRSRVLSMYTGALDWKLGPGRRTAAIAPMALGAGFTFGYMGPFLGGTTVMLPKWDPATLLAMVERERLQSIFLVPTHAYAIRALTETPTEDYDLSSLETIYFNAAALPVPLKEWVIAAFEGVPILELYGSTEASVVTLLRADHALTKAGSVGHPWWNTEVKLLDDDGVPVGPNEPGELFSRSPMNMRGYFNHPEATAAALPGGGWCTAGDVAVADDEGFIYIVDRKKDMVVSGAQNIYPREIENVIVRAAGVCEVAVVGLPDPAWGERLSAFVVAMPGAAPDPTAMEELVRAELAGYKVPREWRFVDALPRNANGKIMKNVLRADAIAADAAATTG
jgi:acyl-CoA synthetase (AMP-forming)/AMP-acid ligase II